MFPPSIDKKKSYKQDVLERLVHIEDKINSIIDNGRKDVDRYAKRTWSQNGEDIVIWNKFQEIGIEKPTYLDMGANHPYEISNTALFYENGCRGVNIDANPNNMILFEQCRPEDINICCGVGAIETIMPFYMIDERSGRNSFIKENVEEFVNDNTDFEITEVREIPVKRIQTILDECNDGKMPDYVSIDIEGMEYEVLKTMDLDNNGPIMITVEVQKKHQERSAPIIKLMEEGGYSLFFAVGSNYTFIKNDSLQGQS